MSYQAEPYSDPGYGAKRFLITTDEGRQFDVSVAVDESEIPALVAFHLNPPAPAPYPVLPTIDDYRAAIQAHVDATAQARNYDSGLTCASYVGSTNPAWAAEAAAFVAWRDAVWVYAFTELPKVQSGQREQPTIAAFLDELPVMIWPN
ncbi:hypothetical protein IED13_04160 [Bosea sp. SSUT16]|jgi:hypothetical protein|uniref:Uncharacterized protein n=1 Tax=Bosea spartocytisi TaxID=2773451 RepID=A0A927E9V8_9HYPH|nr:hypothetical protein [Bosea spartocytisi]MBD3844879.1 hypothetical protein [Bosea spartocytisi]MCT4471081.1 hypothetical protein [Bosea spartocytisi]